VSPPESHTAPASTIIVPTATKPINLAAARTTTDPRRASRFRPAQGTASTAATTRGSGTSTLRTAILAGRRRGERGG
jgi:hypothetical protein